MRLPPSLRRPTAGEEPSPPDEDLRVYLLRVLAGVVALLLVPVTLILLLETFFHIRLQEGDKSLVRLILGSFFFTYLAILGFKAPIQRIRRWWRADTRGRQAKGTGKPPPPPSAGKKEAPP